MLGGFATLTTSLFLPVPPQQDHASSERRKRQDPRSAWDPSVLAPLQLAVTLSPYTSISSSLFLRTLQDGHAASYWLSLQPHTGGSPVRDLSSPEPAPQPKPALNLNKHPHYGENLILLCWGPAPCCRAMPGGATFLFLKEVAFKFLLPKDISKSC